MKAEERDCAGPKPTFVAVAANADPAATRPTRTAGSRRSRPRGSASAALLPDPFATTANELSGIRQ